MKNLYVGYLITGLCLFGLSVSAAHAGQCKQVKLLNAPAVNTKPVTYRFARPLRFHTAYYCPDNGMYYPQTLGCMSPWVVVQH